MNDIKQFKLSSGEEIVCDVIEWQDVEGDDPNIVVRNAYCLLQLGTKKGVNYYQFSPWMVYQNDPEFFQVINSMHILGEANPPKALLEQYISVVTADTLTDEEIGDKMQGYINNLKLVLQDLDPPSQPDEIRPNIVPFKPKIH